MRRSSTPAQPVDSPTLRTGRFRRALGRTQHPPDDALTGCESMEALDDGYRSMSRRANRDRSHVALLTCDIDGFRRVNEEFGRHRGDSVIVAFADRVKQTVRDTDHVYRSGGETFVVTAYGADADGARIAAERVRDAVAATPIGGCALTVSIGIALGVDQGDEPRELFARSSRAMREAKKRGRGQILVAE